MIEVNLQQSAVAGLPEAPFVLLGAGFGQKQGELYRRPIALLRAERPAEVAPALAALDGAVAAGHDVAGYFAYELGYLFEPRLAPLLPQIRPTPLLLLGIFAGGSRAPELGNGFAPPPTELSSTMSIPAYEAGVERILELIKAGDVYQVNLTHGRDFETGDPLALYPALLAHQSVPYPAIVDLGGPLILSLSPELFFRIEKGRISARPMKGTAMRSRTLEDDEAAGRALARDPKNRAENLMITDLLRNDLSKIAAPGSVRVPALFTLETYRTLHTLTSTIEAELREGAAPSEILRALFPCGSVTGAPKIRAMEIIRELEPEPRGVYTGAIGVFRGDGSACFNVAIRTLTVENGRGRLGVGGGIVADSDARAEAEETRLKARFLTGLSPYPADQMPLGLIETMRFERGAGILRLERHLARLAASAAYFNIAVDLAAVRRSLAERTAKFTDAMRVRLLVPESGAPSITAEPLAPVAPPWRCRLSDHRIDSADPFRAHKTTRRGLYDEEYARGRADGFDEVLFLNERGELAEGSRTNLFLERDGKLLTPEISAGALPGILRAELLESGRAIEARLTPADLAPGVLLVGNSLRGLVRAVLKV
jgi:para-aminobenzoate synthetase/4-amino-4-deoxychorismate lyase